MGPPMLATTGPSIGSLPADAADEDLFRALRTASPEESERIDALLVARHSSLVRWIASCYAHRGVEIEELRQVAFVGLMLAIRRFDSDRGVGFATFASPTVRGEIQRHFRDRRRLIRLPRRLQELKAALRAAADELVQTLGRWPSPAELAAFLQVDEKDVREALAAEDTFTLPSIDDSMTEGGGSCLADVLGGPDPCLDLVVDSHVLRGLLAGLPARDQQIVQLSFFGDQTQCQIGGRLGISQMQVSRLLKSALGRLRVQLDAAA
jgi:RNA polymerase sigma-B factor